MSRVSRFGTLLVALTMTLPACAGTDTTGTTGADTTATTAAEGGTTTSSAEGEETTTSEAAAPEGRADVLRVALSSFAEENLNPLIMDGVTSLDLSVLIFDPIVYFDTEGNSLPGVAESWEFDDDGLGATFHIRQDMEFHVQSADRRRRGVQPAVLDGRRTSTERHQSQVAQFGR